MLSGVEIYLFVLEEGGTLFPFSDLYRILSKDWSYIMTNLGCLKLILWWLACRPKNLCSSSFLDRFSVRWWKVLLLSVYSYDGSQNCHTLKLTVSNVHLKWKSTGNCKLLNLCSRFLSFVYSMKRWRSLLH